MIRRTPLPRSTKPLERKPMKRKQRHGDKPEVRAAYMQTHLRCALCFARAGSFGVVLHCHHIIGRQRVDVPLNLLSLCDRCHRHYHAGGEFDSNGERLPEINCGVMLQAKREADGLREKALLALARRESWPANWKQEIPGAFLRERRING